ncbi:RES domain-containing protein (plasmid) [Acidiphilium multivorum]|uniref:RES family NAD+ phosphorylase n=1 Tax=Acidiphilium multivorum TaxID=62140 RepID=UPI001F4BE8DD|nr:RES domain-containing protein [Acidiphilium multivorum]UNC16320.1 RES domain-containing protein [Acidiphilium multivorum]
MTAASYKGLLYRAINPIYAVDPMSGEGARIYGGRFNPRGVPAIYCSISVMTAVREANQAGALQPTTLVSYDAEIERVFDARDVSAVEAEGFSPGTLASQTWRDEMKAGKQSQTQVFASRLIAKNYCALLVPSYVAGATPSDLNLVLWKWGSSTPSRLGNVSV